MEKPPLFRTACGGDSGIAMVLTVWALAILAVIVGEIVFSSRLKTKADMHLMREVQSYGLALAAYHAALDALGEDLTGLSRDDEGRLVLHRGKDDPEVAAESVGVPLGEGTYSFAIDDEDGRIDINRQARPGLVALFRKAGLEAGAARDGLVDSILDWRDPGREHHLNGAEEDYYRSLEEPYSCKDGPLDVVEELLLVKGMKPEYLFGGTVDEATFLPAGDWITVYPATFNTATASDEVLEILRRSRPPASAPARLSQYFTIVASGKAAEDGPQRHIKAVVRREGGGGKIDFQLLYWNDNYYPYGSEYAVD
jgi:general secretion pathway protein K